MATNDEGYIAVRNYAQGRVVVQHTTTGREYLLTTKNNICMAYIHPDDVTEMLTRIKVCCGGVRKQHFYLATDQEAGKWNK